MMENIIYFKEYSYNIGGVEKNPHFVPSSGKWFVGLVEVPLAHLSPLFGLDEEELVMLRLTYGG